MSLTGYVSTGAFFDTGIGIARIHGEIEYYCSRSDNTVTFWSTYARIKYVRESGSWTSFYYNAGWTWRLDIASGTERVSNGANGTRSVNQTDNGSAVGFSIGVAVGASTIAARIGANFAGDGVTYADHTLYIPTVSAPSGQTASASSVQATTATLNASISSWGSNCTAGTGQRLEYRKSGGSWTALAYSTASSHSRNITGLSPGSTYEVRTYALNGAGLGGNSATITFQTKSGVKMILPNGTVEDRIVKRILPTGVVSERVVTKIVV